MRLFFDTEFLEDGRTIELISIGVVREDGAVFYAETVAAHRLARSNEWLAENVAPHLTGQVLELPELRAGLLQIAGPDPEFWAYYADYDWVVLCQIFGRMVDLPDGWPMYCRDLKQLMDDRGIARSSLPEQEGAEHNALADAQWNRDVFDLLAAPSEPPSDSEPKP